MNFDLGTSALRKALTPKTYTLRCKILELGDFYKVQCTMNAGEEVHLDFWAKPLLSLSYSYEVEDEVIVEVRNLCEAYILGLAKELSETNTTEEFYVRLGKNILKGRKDGTQFEFQGGDDGFRIEHSPAGTNVETKGVLSIAADMIMLGDGMGLGLNCNTACPLMGMHVPTQQKVLF
jgi:hypothetical protein